MFYWHGLIGQQIFNLLSEAGQEYFFFVDALMQNLKLKKSFDETYRHSQEEKY